MHPSHKRKPESWALLLLAAVASLPLPAAAVDEELEEGRVFAIQNRAYRMNHEFAVSVAFLPLDAIFKYFAVSGHYVVHFDDFWAWEAVHFSFTKYLDVDTGLQKEMLDRWGIGATDTTRLDYFLDTNLMIKPLYGKMALFDSLVVHMETYFVLGIGAERFESGAWFPAVDLGAGMRVFLTDTLSLRIEAREYVYLADAGVDSTLYFGVSFCFNAFAEERKLGEAGEVAP